MSQPPVQQQTPAAQSIIPKDINLIKKVENVLDTFGGMRTGEYMVHVLIEETRGLVNPNDKEAPVDCIITAQCFNKKKYTTVKKGLHSGATTWNEHFFFNEVIDNVQKLEHQKIVLTVSDHKLLGADAFLGSVELDFSNVYGSEKHTITHQWAALANLEKNFQKILGFLKFSVTIVTEGDQTVQLKPEELTTGFDQKNIIMPPFMEKKLYQITITVNRGEQIKKMDTWGGTVDPFIKVMLGNIIQKTKVISNNINPVWNQIIKIPIALPTVNDSLSVQLFDHDQVKANELIGTTHISIKDIEEGKYDQFAWNSFYSCPPKTSGKYADLMNNNPSLASHWCGRINFKITLEKNKSAHAGVVDLVDNKLIDTLAKEPYQKYELRAEAYYGMNLPENGKKYSLRIKWAQNETKTKELDVPKGRMAEWYQTMPSISASFPDKSIDQLPDVIVYLYRGDKHFSFMRLPASYFTKQDRKAEVFFLKIDKSIADVKDNLAGVVRLRIWIHAPNAQTNLAIGGWDKVLSKKPDMKKWRVIANLYQAQDLIAGDDNGSSDPICEIYFSGWIFKSQPIMNTLNPIWNFRMEFPAEFDDFKDCPPFVLNIWDYDVIGENDYLGGTVLTIDENCLGQNKPVTPTWRSLKYGALDKDFGKVLISFNVYPATQQIIPYGDIDPPTAKYWLNMKVLGLRGLKSLGVMPVKKPYVKFDLNSVRAPRRKIEIEEKKYVQTQPKEKGPHANLLTVVNMEVDLPLDPLYCPSLSCRVHDFYLRGMAQPLLGTFSIPLGRFLEEMKIRQISKNAKVDSIQDNINTSSIKINTQLVSQAKKTLEKSVNIVDDEDDEEDDEATLADINQKHLESTKDKLLPTHNAKSDVGGELMKIKTIQFNEKSLKKFVEDANITLFPFPSDKIIVLPEYEKHPIKGYEVEKNLPDLGQYIDIGYDGTTRKEKHYRYCLNKPLETSGFMDECPFDEVPIKRGEQVSDDRIFSKVFGGSHKKEQPEESETVGMFKAMITVMTEDEKKEADDFVISNPARTKKSTKIEHIKETVLGIPDLDFLKKQHVLVRCYIIDAFDLAAKDEDSNSDPYLVVELGDKKYDESKYYQLDQPNPKFYKLFEFPATIPGASQLKVTVMDNDEFARDDMIGETIIDIEDRWFSKKFRQLHEVPAETRKLYNPGSRLEQGSIRLFVDIIPREDYLNKRKWDLSMKPPKDYELRVIVWEVDGLPITDCSGQIDIYMVGRLADGTKLKTDTHWASRNGKGSFNWRMIFPVTLPLKDNKITFAAYDKDIVSADDHIAEGTIDFSEQANEAFMYEQSAKMYNAETKSDKMVIDLLRSDDKTGGFSVNGKLTISLQLVPKEIAELNKAGQGRSEPNQDPFLAPPIGRIKWSLNPLDMWEMYVGPVYRHRVYMFCGIALLVLMVVLSFPHIMLAMLSGIFSGMFSLLSNY